MRRKTWLSRRTLLPLALVAALLAALGAAQYLRMKAPPEAARLLPDSEAIFFVHVKPLRAATHFDTSPVHRSPDLQRFVDATGIVPERDLDSVALALHPMPDPHGPNGPMAYSEVFVGRFDGAKLQAYLKDLAKDRERYEGRDIYTIPVEGRTLRVVQLGYDTIAASNTPSVEAIHSMVDRSRAAALNHPGSSLLAARYREVPLLSLAWGIGHLGLPFAQHGHHVTLMGLELPLRDDTDLVASLRYKAPVPLRPGAVQLRVEEIAPSSSAAERSAEAVGALLNIVRGIAEAGPAQTESSHAMRAVLDSATIEQRADRAALDASATPEQLRALALSQDPSEGGAGEATPSVSPASNPLQ